MKKQIDLNLTLYFIYRERLRIKIINIAMNKAICIYIYDIQMIMQYYTLLGRLEI